MCDPESMQEPSPEPKAGNTSTSFAYGLTPQEVERFRDIMRRESSVEFGEAEAWSRAIELLALFRTLLGPLPEDRSRIGT
jgi:hypothetical protein